MRNFLLRKIILIFVCIAFLEDNKPSEKVAKERRQTIIFKVNMGCLFAAKPQSLHKFVRITVSVCLCICTIPVIRIGSGILDKPARLLLSLIVFWTRRA